VQSDEHLVVEAQKREELETYAAVWQRKAAQAAPLNRA
jgi:hypothetical protein